MQLKEECLLINLGDTLHQEVMIDSINVKIHYNYLVDIFYLNVYVDEVHTVSNVPIVPNIDLFKGLTYKLRDNKPIGTLVFSCKLGTEKFTKEIFDNKDFECIYFEEPTEAIPDE